MSTCRLKLLRRRAASTAVFAGRRFYWYWRIEGAGLCANAVCRAGYASANDTIMPIAAARFAAGLQQETESRQVSSPQVSCGREPASPGYRRDDGRNTRQIHPVMPQAVMPLGSYTTDV